ncbi:glycosyltransferase [Candidatus Uhrbacteria bacterium]|nr:glycosyltransferase [Candidatus Uhrbacteria bacterium]
MLSIIIPTKNEETLLPRLLASIKRQTVAPKEIIVADAWSTDTTRLIAAAHGAIIVDGGMPAAGRNRGAEKATGDVLLFLDADVELTDPTFLERAAVDLEARGLDVATCDVAPLYGKRIDHYLHEAYNMYVRLWGATLPHAPGFCLFARHDIHRAIHGFDETILFCEDHDYARRAGKCGRFGFLNGVCVPASTRRLDRDGRLAVALKYTAAEFHLFFAPIRHAGFRYTFGHTHSSDQTP